MLLLAVPNIMERRLDGRVDILDITAVRQACSQWNQAGCPPVLSSLRPETRSQKA